MRAADDALFSSSEIDDAVGNLEGRATASGKGLRETGLGLDVDDVVAVSKGGAWDSAGNKRFLERNTNRITKNALTEFAPQPPSTHVSLAEAEAAGPEAFRTAAQQMLTRPFSDVAELEAITQQARAAMRNVDRPVGQLRDAINKSIRGRIRNSVGPDAARVNRALGAAGIDPATLKALPRGPAAAPEPTAPSGAAPRGPAAAPERTVPSGAAPRGHAATPEPTAPSGAAPRGHAATPEPTVPSGAAPRGPAAAPEPTVPSGAAPRGPAAPSDPTIPSGPAPRGPAATPDPTIPSGAAPRVPVAAHTANAAAAAITLIGMLVLPRLEEGRERDLIANRVRELRPEIERQAAAQHDHLMQIRSPEGRVWARIGVVLCRNDTLMGGGTGGPEYAGWHESTVDVKPSNSHLGRLSETIDFADRLADPSAPPETHWEQSERGFEQRWEWRYMVSVPLEVWEWRSTTSVPELRGRGGR